MASTLVEEGDFIKEAKVPVQKFDSQKGEGAYFLDGEWVR